MTEEKSKEGKIEEAKKHCLNCERELLESASFCSDCGQKVGRIKPLLRSLISDFFVAQFSIEGRLFQSLRTLLLFPGKLTVDYWEGKRARYFTPIQVYLATSVLFFLLLDSLSMVAQNSPIEIEVPDMRKQVEKMDQEEFPVTLGFRQVTMSREQFIQFAETDSDQLEDFFAQHEFQVDDTTLFFARVGHIVVQPDGLKQFVAKYFKIFSQTIIVLMPLFGFILYGLYWRKAESTVKCIVFSAHFHAFAFLIFIFLALIMANVRSQVAPPLFSIAIMVYFVLAQRTVFGGGWGAIILKSIVAGIVYSVFILLLVVLLIPVVYFTL